MRPQRFRNEVRRLFRTAFIQKLIVMVMRSAWIGGAVYIFCWGSNELWDWFPHQERWIYYAAATSLLTLASVFRHLKAIRRFIWRVDQKFDFDEQLFTAYERVDQFGSEAEDDPGTKLLLESDVIGRFPKLRRQLTKRSGQLRREIESTIVVLILLLVIYLAGIGSIDRIPFATGLSFLPPVPSEPQSRDIFNSGIPGDETEPADPDEQQSEDEEPEGADYRFEPLCDPSLLLEPAVWRQTQDLLSQLGDGLCCGSATMGLSETLRLPDYAAAGNEFSVMAGKIGEYSSETRQMLSEKFLGASVQFQQIGQQEASVGFASTASALLNGTSGEMAEGLDGLSVLMRQYEAQQRCITIADWQPGGQLLPSTTDIDPSDLPVFSSGVDFIPVQDSPLDSSAEVTGAEGSMQSYEVPMEETDVVSSYFSPD